MEGELSMTKLFSVFMAFAIVLSLAACGSGNGTEESSHSTEQGTSVQMAEDGTKEDASGTEPASDEQESEGTGEPTSEETDKTGSKALVVYFSATGNTKTVAETLAGLQEADIYEIVPEKPYTEEDLNYNDRTTRATAEQNDPDARPAISGSIENLEQYEVIYVGFPIWLAYHNLIQCTRG